ncbi:Peptidase S54, rhomboid domain containing protein [Fimbriimonadaceae bacterium]
MTAQPRPPVITLLLVAGNLFAAFAVLINPDLVYQFGFDSRNPQFRAYITSLFLHQNVIHLLGNMLFLAAVGSAVEMSTGWFRFALVYFLSGGAGLMLHYFMTRSLENPVPYIGASGCVAGCIGYYALRYQAVRVPVVPRLALPVLVITLVWLGLQLVGAVVRIGDSGGTAYWAHIGGFGMGVMLSLVFRTPDFGQRQVARQALDQMSIRGPAAMKIAAERHLQRYPSDPHAVSELAIACRGLSDVEGEAEAICQLMVLDLSRTHECLTRLIELRQIERISAVERSQFADRFSSTDPILADELFQSVAESSDARAKPDALLAWAKFAREHDAEKATELLTQLQSEFPLSGATEVARTRGWLR